MTTTLPEGYKRVECPEPVEGLSFIYILYCRNGTYYVGRTKDVSMRVIRHASGAGARHTNQMKEFELVHVEGPMTPEIAIKREKQLKKWSRAKKNALILGDFNEIRRLSRSRE